MHHQHVTDTVAKLCSSIAEQWAWQNYYGESHCFSATTNEVLFLAVVGWVFASR